MKKQLPLIITFLYTILSACCIAQTNTQQITPKHNEKSNNYPYSVFFQNAYRQYSDIPVGMLEAVSYTMTHLHHVDSTTSESCTGIPRVYGVMGLTLNGKGYFRNNLLLISQLSGFTVNDIINNPEVNILAYAAAYSSLMKQAGTKTEDIEKQVNILKALSEIPNNLTNEFALNSYIYSVLSFLNGSNNQQVYNFSNHEIDISNIFGVENYRLLSSPTVVIKKNERRSDLDTLTSSAPPLDILSSDYGPAIWNPAASCNYTVGRTASISAVAIHDTEGSYSGTISWFQNCSSVLSSHYVIRSSDGQVTQMVLEANRAYHVGSENTYTIGIEHEGYCSQPGWYTNAMYCSSANLVKDICNSGYGISPTSAYSGIACNCSSSSASCQKASTIKIKGHQMFPSQTHTDPGPNWDWSYYYSLINGASCGSISAAPLNDLCGNAQPLTSNTSCSYSQGTVTGATQSLSTKPSCDGFSNPSMLDVWYTFTAKATSTTISVVPIGDLDAVLAIYSGTCTGLTQVGCNETPGSNSATATLSTTIGTTYYVRVYDYGASPPANGSFNICVTHICVTPSPPTLSNFNNSSCPGVSTSNYPSLTVSSSSTFINFYVSQYPYRDANIIEQPCQREKFFSPTTKSGMLYRWNTKGGEGPCPTATCPSSFSSLGYFYVPPSISPSSSQTTCANNNVAFSTIVNPPGTGGSVAVQWYKDNNPIPNAISTTYSATTTGNYKVRFTFTGSQDCPSIFIESQVVNVSVSPTPTTPIISGNTSFCEGESTTVSVSPASQCSGCTYTWSNGQQGNSISVMNSGSYTVTASLGGNCGNATSQPINVTVNPKPIATATPNPGTINAGQSSTLTATGGGTYAWSPNNCQSSTCTVSPTTTTTYVVTVTSSAGCTATTSTTVTVNGVIPCEVTIPTSAQIGSQGSTGSVSITTNPSGCQWTATLGADCGNWLTLTSTTGTGNTLQYSYTTNTSTTQRVCTITINGKIHTITQQGSNPSCTAPTNLVVSNITQTSATVTWVNGQNITDVQVGVKPTNSTAYNTYNMPSISTTTFTIPQLICGTNYDVRILSNCSTGSPVFVTMPFSTLPCNCSYTLGIPPNVGYAGYPITPLAFPITTTAACTWTVMPIANYPWLTNLTTSGTGQGQIMMNIAACDNTTNKQATLKVTGQNGYSENVNIIQICSNQQCNLQATKIKLMGCELSVMPVNNVTYKWYRSGVEILNNNTPFQVVDRSATYQCIIIDNSNPSCTSPSQYFYATYNPCVDSKEIPELKKLVVYPNPNKGTFIIEFDLLELKDMGIKIYNAIGQQVYNRSRSKFIGKFKEQIDLRHLSAGIYLVTIEINDKKVVKNIVIE